MDVSAAFFMESLDTTILNTAVPAVAQALQVEPLSMKAVLSSYTLSLAVFIPPARWCASRFATASSTERVKRSAELTADGHKSTPVKTQPAVRLDF